MADESLNDLLKAKTSEGAQEMLARQETTVKELRAEYGGVLRLAEGVSIDPGDYNYESPDDETTILNLGPSHPSTHGVLRVMVEVRGEQVLRVKPVIGYLHTGMEKTGEELMYHQGSTNVTRMDYLSPFFNEVAYSLSVEKLAEIKVPARATWIRMLMCELNRIASHLLWLATNGADLGAINMLVYGWRDRELVLAFFDKVTGLRMNHNYIRPGGVAAELPDGWRDDVRAICDAVLKRMDEYDNLLTGQPLLQNRMDGVGPLDAPTAVGLGLTGPYCDLPASLTTSAETFLTWRTTTSSSTSSSAPRETAGTALPSAPTRSASLCASFVKWPTPCREGTSGLRTRSSPRRPATASTSRWKH